MREIVLTPVILAIARGKGGSEQRALTPLRRDPRESPGEFQIVQIHGAFTAKVTRVTLRCNVFVDLFIPLSSKTPSFDSFFGRLPARNAQN